MSTTLTEQLLAQLQGAPLQHISQQLGVGPTQTAGAVSAALPLLLGALGRNAAQPQGAQALFGALQRDHPAGDLGRLLGSVLGGGASSRETDGAGILGHILGSQQPRAEAGLGAATGLSGAQSGQLLKMLAPLVLAFLSKQLTQGGGGADLLGSLLGQEQSQLRQQGGAAGGLLGAVLDQDGDGKVNIGDLVKLGSGLLGGRR